MHHYYTMVSFKKIYILVHWGNLNQILSLKNNWGKGKSKLTLFRKQIETFLPKVSMPTKAESGRVLYSIHHHGSPDYDWSCPFRNS